MKRLLFIFFLVFFTSPLFAQETKPLTIGEIKTLKSVVLKEDRTLNIYLPSTYDSSKSYPVIYVLDGSMN